VLHAQSEETRVTRHRTIAIEDSAGVSALLDKAESLIAKADYASAEDLLKQATAKDASSYQAWYDLGYAEHALNHSAEAIAAYRKSVEVNPKVFESNLNLGLELASTGAREEAIRYLKNATGLEPSQNANRSKERAWLVLGQVQSDTDPAAAEEALGQAAKLEPGDPQPHLLLAQLYEGSNKFDAAKQQYELALTGANDQTRLQALRGLVNVAIASQQYGEAEPRLRDYLAAATRDPQAHLLLGRLLAAQGKNEEALSQLAAAGDTNDPKVLEEKASLLTALHREPEALPIYKQLIQGDGNDAALHYQYGVALMHDHQFGPAQEQLLAAIKLNPNLGNAYGDLAVAASDNGQYDLVLKALNMRTKFLGENPGTYFLRATALDHLRRYPEATQNYRQFLAVSNGKFPDEEWKARHRLLAIQNLK
jgi:tetratricopeptide (TPR) repeat protein